MQAVKKITDLRIEHTPETRKLTFSDLIDAYCAVKIRIIQIQVTVFFIAFQDAFTLQKAGNPVADRMHQLRQFVLVGCVLSFTDEIDPSPTCSSPRHAPGW